MSKQLQNHNQNTEHHQGQNYQVLQGDGILSWNWWAVNLNLSVE